MCISRSTANGLDEAASAAQEALFICVQNCDERHLRDVEALTQQDALLAEAIVLCIVGFLAIYCIELAARIVVKKQEE